MNIIIEDKIGYNTLDVNSIKLSKLEKEELKILEEIEKLIKLKAVAKRLKC